MFRFILPTVLLTTPLPFAACAQQTTETVTEAQAHMAAENWAAALSAYESLLEADEQNADHWFNAGRAHQHLGDIEKAADAYRTAIEFDYQPVSRVRIYLARAHMLLGQEEDALSELETVAEVGAANYRTLQAIPEFEALANSPKFIAVIDALRPCNTEDYRHFDFWIGEWDVTSAGSASPSATNSISRQHDGCTLVEDYVAGAFTGMSVNFYDSNTDKWHQTWISNAGGALYIEGGLNEQGQMVLTDKDLPSSAITNTINKITWTPNEDGSVRQFWETSADNGESWTVAFDGLYTKTESDN